jgi:integrase
VASIRKISTKSAGTVWQARWRERGADGRDRSCARNFHTARAARDFASRMAQLVERRGIGDPERLTTATFLIHFVDELAGSGDYSPVTISVYRRCLGLAARELGEIPLARLTTSHIDRALSALLRVGGRSRQDPNRRRPLTRATVHLVHRVLSIALGRAVKRHLIASNPVTDASAPSLPRRTAQGFSAEEVKALLTAAAATDAETLTLTALLLATGLRRSEVLGVAFDDIDFEAATLTVRRTVVEIAGRPVERAGGKSAAALRTISIPGALVDLLRAQKTRIQEQALAWGSYQRDPLYCFPGLGGRALAPKCLTQRMRALMQAAGISGRAPVHRWRHTSGSLLYDLTGNFKVVQRRLGHASHHTTMSIYVHPAAERDREASEHFERILMATKTRT